MTAVDLDRIHLGHGSHRSRGDGMCLMEAVAYIAGEPHTDHPQCACPVLAAFGRAWNDGLPGEDRDRLLRQFVPRLIGTRSTPAVECQRAYMVADWAVRVYAPVWLYAAGLEDVAAELEGLAPLHTVESFAVIALARAAAEGAAQGAAWAAVEDAVTAAIEAAAGGAATAASAMAAARGSARGAARARLQAIDAAEYAAMAAAASGVALRPHVERLQDSAVGLFERMIEVNP